MEAETRDVIEPQKPKETDVHDKLAVEEDDLTSFGTGTGSASHDTFDDKRRKLVKGDYVVQVHVIEGRDIKGRGRTDMSDPVIRVSCMGNTQSTQIKKECANCIWDQVLFFEYKGLEAEEILQGKVQLECFDANTIMRDVLIGAFEFDVSQVYFNADHELHRQWVALTDTTNTYEGIQGYVRASIIVLGPNDEQKIHPLVEEDEDETNLLQVLVPPEIEQIPKLLVISLYQCRNLPAMDVGILGSQCDPYVWAQFAGIKVKSKRRKGLNPDLVNEINIPVMEPIMASAIKLCLFDWNAATRNDRIATLTFNYNKIKRMGGLGPKWVPMYGAPIGRQKGIAAKMNRGVLEGTCYRGDMLLKIEIRDEKEPKKGLVDIGLLLESQCPKETSYLIRFDLYEGTEIVSFAMFGEMHVEIHIGSNCARSSRVPVKDGRCEWYETIVSSGPGGAQTENKEFGPLYLQKDLNQVPDLFVYLCNQKRRISFCRIPFKEIVQQHWLCHPKWWNLKEDKATDFLNEDVFPGALMFSVRGGLTATAPEVPLYSSRPFKSGSVSDQDIARLNRRISTRPRMSRGTRHPDETTPLMALMDDDEGDNEPAAQVPTVGKLQLWMYQAQDLPAMDSNGTSDPFATIKTSNKDGKEFFARTRTIDKNLNPKWYQKFEFDMIPVSETLQIAIFDQDPVSNDLLGKLTLLLSAQSKKPPGKDFDAKSWYFLTTKTENAKTARLQLRLKFTFADCKHRAKKPTGLQNLMQNTGLMKKKKDLSITSDFGTPPKHSMQLRAHIYMARNLQAFDRNGLSDPYIRIRFCGMDVQTTLLKKTLNPEWFKTFNMNVMCPDPQYAPDIQLVVYDWDQFTRDDQLGRFSVKAIDCLLRSGRGEIRPKWYDLFDADGEHVEGQVLAAFQLIKVGSRVEPIPESLAPATKNAWLQIVTLGLRSLNCLGGVGQPYLEFKLPNSKTYKTKKSRHPSPENPNYLQILKIPIKVPLDPMYASSLKINVKDNMFGGFVKRTIGHASLCIADFLETNDIEFFNEKKAKQDMANELKRQADEDEQKLKDLEEQRRREEEERMAKKEAKRIKKKRKKRAAELRIPLEDVVVTEEEDQDAKWDEDGHPIWPRDAEGNEIIPTDVEGNVILPKRKTPSKLKAKKTTPGTIVHTDEKAHEAGEILGEVELISKPPCDLEVSDSDESSSCHEEKSLLAGSGAGKREKSPASPEAADLCNLIKDQDQESLEDSSDFDLEEEQHVDMSTEVLSYMVHRDIVDDELEDEVDMDPFQKFQLFTGSRGGSKLLGAQYRKVGLLKGLIAITDKKTDPIGIDIKSLLKPKSCFVRLYVLRGHRLTPKDDDGTCDPYLYVSLGKKTYSTRKHFIKNTLEPEFYEVFEIPCTIPGESMLKIAVWDWDGFNDDLVGTTEIDIEDRWFSQQWRKLPKKPVEFRTLKAPSSTFAQGKLELWVDILTTTQMKKMPVWNIKPPPPVPFEMRVIIWCCREITIKDEWTQMNDLYITGTLDLPGIKQQSTDLHYRSKKGVGNFNWRMKFPVDLPVKRPPRFRLAIWDKDYFSANDSICEANLSLAGLFKKAFNMKDKVQMKSRGKDRIWINELRHPNFEGNQGRIEVSIEIMPLAIAAQLPAGFGRSEPNMNPFLPEPKGRTKIDLLDPFGTLRGIVGDRALMKLCVGFIITGITSFLILLGPTLASTMMAKAMAGGMF